MSGILGQSFELMLVGMGFVFVFLTILVGAMTLMSRLVGKYFPEAPPQARAVIPPAASPAPAQIDPTTLAVLSAAIQKHRSQKK